MTVNWEQEAERHLSAANVCDLSASKGPDRYTYTLQASSHRHAALTCSLLALTKELRAANQADDRMKQVSVFLDKLIEKTVPSEDGEP
ncbi:hypothetical protein [Hoyosella altamirensis]|uniref:Uncharacterized protein n=1 Tax=Hoyosella altamirensis TaxID=616997 RepID=A0A839RUL0_9ACTN|nr:hypothetical protein [Hoyosella altamirensis]MBB3039425.1 hypothetical protein [Hoyosella altamirensis]MBB3039997.1 hypothetical protein [Hoyosella altamirensis]